MRLMTNFLPRVMTGDIRRGGWQVQGVLQSETDGLVFGQNVKVSGLNMSGGIIDQFYRDLFNGHCMTGPAAIQFAKYTSSANITVGTADNLLKGWLQDISFVESASPNHGHEITGLDLAAIIEHVLRKHCNAVYDAADTPSGVVTELNLMTDSTSRIRFIVRKSNNLWHRLQEIGGGDTLGEFAYPWFKRDNSFHYDFSPFFQTPKPISKGTITEDHIIGQVRVNLLDANPLTRVGQVDIVSVALGNAFFDSRYPTPQADGKIYQVPTGVWASTQQEADTRAEQLYRWLTRPFQITVPVDANLLLYGDDGLGIDLGDAVQVVYNGPADDGGNGVHLNINHLCYLYGARVSFNTQNDTATAQLILEADN